MKKITNLGDLEFALRSDCFIYLQQSTKIDKIDFLSKSLMEVMKLVKQGKLFYTTDY